MKVEPRDEKNEQSVGMTGQLAEHHAKTKGSLDDTALTTPGKYEVTPETTFKVELLLVNKDGRYVIVSDSEQEGVEKHWVEFRMWTFDEEVELRKMAMQFDENRRMHFMDNDRLNMIKLRRLIKAWSFENVGPRYKLLHVNGVLADESWNIVRKLFPSITTAIIVGMNNVLEFNG